MATGFDPRFAEDVLGPLESSGPSSRRNYERRGDAIRAARALGDQLTV